MEAIDVVDQKLRSFCILISRQHLEYYFAYCHKYGDYKVYLVSLTGFVGDVATASVVGQL